MRAFVCSQPTGALCVPHYLSVVFHQTLQVGLVSGMVFLPFGQVLQAVETDGPPTIRNHTLQLDTNLLELELIAFEYTSMDTCIAFELVAYLMVPLSRHFIIMLVEERILLAVWFGKCQPLRGQ